MHKVYRGRQEAAGILLRLIWSLTAAQLPGSSKAADGRAERWEQHRCE